MPGVQDKLAFSLLSNGPGSSHRWRDAACGHVLSDPDESLATAVDTLVEGTHYRVGARAEDVAWKALAVNLSDMAAMGADPRSVVVSLSMPASAQGWFAAFRRGFESAAAEYHLNVVAATVVAGAAVVTVEVCGGIPRRAALTRRGARAGDAIYVTGTLGDAGIGLRISQDGIGVSNADTDFLLARLDRPTPRLAAGRALRGVASAAIDISDGLAGDLGHILSASDVGARVEVERLPLSHQLRRVVSIGEGYRLAVSAGDDYELCFTVPPERQASFEAVRESMEVAATRIGVVEFQRGLRFVFDDGSAFDADPAFNHFA